MRKIHNTIVKHFIGGRMVVIVSDRPFSGGRKKREAEEALDELFAQLEIEKAVQDVKVKDKEEASARSIARTRQQMYDIVHSNVWDLFITVTFSPEKVDDRYDYDGIAKKFSQLIKDIKKRKAPDLEYIFVVELHQDGAFHFHGLLKGIKGLTLEKARRAKSAGIKAYFEEIKTTSGKQVWNMLDFNLGWAEATYVEDSARASNYMLKYITKDLVRSLGESRKRYWCSQGLNRTIKTDLMLSMNEQGELVKLLAESKMTVSAKTVNVEKDGYTNRLTYIVYQDMSENQADNEACWNNLCKSIGVPQNMMNWLNWKSVYEQNGSSFPFDLRPPEEEPYEEVQEYDC